ncbi:peptidoglycan-associated lipoprotein Pal [Solimonas sp. K1W22B-7]|uniref:peptidoglycan-associated lipoprotein Pal n=1 Tax=Solimonas sp. K1W22B-7 TaxID=2303331 RepID=UPI000E3366BC|nr:peptidoglycan-associated lipoprotein Pal [Solimonas sp. K1W22B-7]AXQ29571.1 peptidoglycan-associated lipoprotein Pal [Solimonas sp. K1W22B-7]
MTKNILITGALVAALALAGCSGKKNVRPAAPPADSVGQSSPYGEGYGSTPPPAPIGESSGSVDAERALNNNIIYFEYDSTAISAEGEGVVSKYASYLQGNPTARVRLEGHADERGTREYNLGLGERRAQAVEAALQAKGVAANQLTILSYGEERPAVSGHDESSWTQNRRVQLIRQ